MLLFLLDRVQINGFIIMKPLYYTSADVLAQKYKQKTLYENMHVVDMHLFHTVFFVYTFGQVHQLSRFNKVQGGTQI